MADREFLIRLTKELTEQGKLIEAGWVGLRVMAVPKDAPPIQLEDMRNAFFAGAAHLFASVMSILDPGEEPTEADLDKMSKINDELDRFMEDFKTKHGFSLVNSPTKGSA